MNTRSIRFRLTAWYASLATVVFVVLSVWMVLALNRYLEANLGDGQLRRAHQIARTLLVHVQQSGEDYVVNEIKSVYSPEIMGRFIRISRADGSILFRSGEPKDASFEPSLVPKVAEGTERAFWRKESLPDGRSLIVGVLRFSEPSGRAFVIECGAPTASILAMVDRLKTQLLVVLPIVLVVAVGGGYLLVRQALAPVDQITRKTEQITLHNLSERLPVARTADELERLSISLNHMIERLQEAMLNSQRFIADASHELRTPLTVLRGELERMARDTRLPADSQESAGSLLEEAERLAHIVEGLLAISRLDAGEAQTAWGRFDLAELVATTADQMSLLAQDKNIRVSCEASEAVFVDGDQARLKQVVVNLVDNAIKYTPERGTVDLRVAAGEGQARFEVTDTGIGIPAGALPHVFERFFRVDSARSREQGGAGLGLAIVKSICTAHHGRVEVSSQPGKGSSFRVELPLSVNQKRSSDLQVVYAR
jgi:heavy metal sensor kinase